MIAYIVNNSLRRFTALAISLFLVFPQAHAVSVFMYRSTSNNSSALEFR